MLDSVSPNRNGLATLTDIGAATPGTSPHARKSLLRRVGAAVPREWVPVVRRGLTGVSAHLPTALRDRLYRLVGAMSREMGQIEQTYADWIEHCDRIDEAARRRIAARIAQMPQHPLISVVMPVYDPRPDLLRAAIHSVQDQLYPWWELCIADDASTNPAVVEVLREAEAADPRIRLLRRERNGHISEASNSALGLATGAFIALLDHDDLLPPHALYEVALRIISQPDVDIIYSDEDHVGADGQRHHPYFKPDWDPDLARGQNLVSHFGVYRRSRVLAVGGFRAGYEGSQDYDLALRVAASSSPDRIAHIPRVLYHWRQNLTDRTFSTSELDRCVKNARRAIQDTLPAGAQAMPAPNLPLWSRVKWPLPSPAPMVSVIIDATGYTDLLPPYLESLLTATEYDALEVLVLGVPTELADLIVCKEPRVRCIPDTSVNAAAAMAYGSLLLLLDIGLLPQELEWLREMATQAIRPGIGAVGAKLVTRDGVVLHAGIALGGPDIIHLPYAGRRATDHGYFGHLQLVRSVSALSASCLLLRRDLFQDVGGLDETDLSAPLRDVDFCLKLGQHGYRNLWTPYATLQCIPCPTGRSPAANQQSAALLRQRWGRKLDSDPFWNPNLSAAAGELGLAFPPWHHRPHARQRAQARDRLSRTRQKT